MKPPAMDTPCPDSCEHELRIGSEASLPQTQKLTSVPLGGREEIARMS